ncbi:hypothetical protein LG201_02760 [Methylobacillus gramineus]|uniref:hypothetical protein n=1 Tax=Methylobacillus gramineus TaxID=755169 RepID=UPI001CFFC962|nr:hypothetical protein [Methylobacillus gramineus]MCB5184120.1 hypothetical protein [Methylobacillus gramineus]
MKAMFYSLHAAIWLHALPESRLASHLSEAGHELVYVSCNKSFSHYCTSMSAFNLALNEDVLKKNKICDSCIKNAKKITQSFKSKHLKLHDYIDNETKELVEFLLKDVTVDNFLDFHHENIPVGRLATYEPLLKYKKMSLEFREEQWQDLQVHLRNAIVSLIGFIQIFKQEYPDKIFFYSPQYGVNGVCAEYAVNQGKQAYFLEGSSSNAERYSALRVWEWSQYKLVNPALRHWQDVKNLVSLEDIDRVSAHVSELFKGKSFAVFSAPKTGNFSIREKFNIPQNAKILLASLSSFDEAYAAFVIQGFPERKVKSLVFSDQFEWIKHTINFMKSRPDDYLVIRVHPRDYPNKRDSNQSEQALIWEGMLKVLPDNVKLNSPDQNISLYDFLDDVHALVTGWSATGVEALLHGIPVITYDKYLPSYPEDIHLTGESEHEYYDNLIKVLSLVKSYDNSHIVNAYRWLAVSFSLGTVRINQPLDIGRSWPDKPMYKLLSRVANKFSVNLRKSYDLWNARSNDTDRLRFLSLVLNNQSSLFEGVLADAGHAVSDAEIEAMVKEHSI